MVTKKPAEAEKSKPYGKITPYKMPAKPQGGYSPKGYASRGYSREEEASYTRHYKAHMESSSHHGDRGTYTSVGGKKTYHTDNMTGVRNKADAFAHHKVMAEREGERPNPSKAPLSPPDHDKLVKHETTTSKKSEPEVNPTSTTTVKKGGRKPSLPPNAKGKQELPVVPKEGPSNSQNSARSKLATARHGEAFSKPAETKTVDPVAESKARKTTRTPAKPRATARKPVPAVSAPTTEAERNGPKLSETRHMQPQQSGKHHAESNATSVSKNNAGSSSGGKHSSDAPLYHELSKKYGSVSEQPRPSVSSSKATSAAGLNSMAGQSKGRHAMTSNGPKASELDHVNSQQMGKHAGPYVGKHRKG